MNRLEVASSALTTVAELLRGRADQVQSVRARLSVMDEAEQPTVERGLATLREAWGTVSATVDETLSLIAAIVDRAAVHYRATDDAVAHAAGFDHRLNNRAYVGRDADADAYAYAYADADADRFFNMDPDWINLGTIDLGETPPDGGSDTGADAGRTPTP